MADVLAIEDLHKHFGSGPHAVRANAGVTMRVGAGEVVGLLGHNGAGKTTTIRILSTLASATGGTAVVCGRDVNQDPRGVRSSIALTGQFTALDERLTGRENLIMIGRLFGLSKEDATTSAERLLADFDLEDAADRPVRTYSGGMQRRLDLAASLSGSPEVIFLDEPTVALDPQIRRHIWELVREIAKGGVTVLLTTHYIEEAEALCGRVSIINKGTLIDVQTPRTFCENLGAYAVEWDDADGRAYRFFHTRTEARAHAREIEESMQRVLLRPTNLEDVFIELTGRKEGL